MASFDADSPWKALFEESPIPILIYEAETLALLAVNKAMTRAYGYSAGELLSMSLGELDEQADPTRRGGSAELQRYRRKDGSTAYVKETAQPIQFKGRPAWIVHAVDVTAEKEMEAQFLRGQRLECIGMLASGVAHDLNNILSPIMMSASMLQEELSPASRDEFVSMIERSAQRGVKLLRQVLTFVKGVEGKHVPLSLESVIAEVLEMARQTFPDAIEIRCELPGEPLWKIRGDATKLYQVLLNLAVNARDAMEQGGILKISARSYEMDQAHALRLGNVKPGRYVALTISDTGCGMSEEVRSKLFTPFFTTKAPEKGTGLGLVTVLGIMKGYGGGMEVESAPGRGSTFTLFFPADSVPEQVPKIAKPGGNGGKVVLVVDDEQGICKLVKTILERAGHQVVTAGSGTEAMAEYVRRPGSIKLVLVDLIMPSMDGVVLSRAIKRLDPEALIVATSGAESDNRLQELKALGINRFLKKPYQAPELLAAVKAALEEDAISLEESAEKMPRGQRNLPRKARL